MSDAFTILSGSPEELGLTLTPEGGNLALFSETAEAVDLCLFDRDDAEIARLRLPGRDGPIFHGFIPGLREGARYGLRVHGAFDPARGLRHDPSKLLIDPYALALDRAPALHPSMRERGADSAPFAPRAIAMRPPRAASPRQGKGWGETIIHELHVRGFTRLMPDIPEDLRGTFSGLSHPAAIAHLKDLGVTALEIMPCAAWIDERHLAPLGLSNYWGYNPVALMAPDPRLAPGGWAEVRRSVETLQSHGFDVILDIVLNHSGESDELGPTLSLRGIDNSSYYRLADDPALYCNDAGCGNVLRMDHPATLRLAMDALRAWASFGGVDGFRFDLATTLARRRDGFDPHAPLIAAIEQDPVLRHLKMIAEPWDVGPGGYQLGRFPARWSEWNDRFRDDVRRFWRGDGGMAGALAHALAGSADLFGAGGRPSRSVNFITAHDGFTLADLVAYEHKRNEANGEQNRDGTDANFSWNNGVEGPTTDEAVLARRQRDQRNLLMTLFCARGLPMLAMGAEFGHSQQGANNAYAQDNALTWLDWQGRDRALTRFTGKLIALRRREKALSADAYLTGAVGADGVADAEWFDATGAAMSAERWRDGDNRFVGLALRSGPSRVLALLNAGGECRFVLPRNREGMRWRLDIDAGGCDEGRIFSGGAPVEVQARTVRIFAEAAAGA